MLCPHSQVERTYLHLVLVHVYLLQLVSDSLCVPSVASLQVIKLHVAETLLQLLKGVTKLKTRQRSNT